MFTLVLIVSLFLSIGTLLYTILGNTLSILGIRKARTTLSSGGNRPPISILKPIKGLDPDLESNLISFFQQDYSEFEIIFCVNDEDDPATKTIQKLREHFNRVPSKLVFVPFEGGNPKVGLLKKVWRQAKHDWLLVSDSNVWVEDNFLSQFSKHMRSDVGVVTAPIRALSKGSLGAHLEASYLNTICTRSLFMAQLISGGYVVGKTMLMHKKVVSRMGGLDVLSPYIAEDFMTGYAMKQLGLKVGLLEWPVLQTLGNYSVKQYWDRHLRWGRIRKYQVPLIFAAEFLQSAMFATTLFTGAVLAIGAPAVMILMYAVTWLLADWVQDTVVAARWNMLFPFIWVLRELMILPHWIHCASGNTVDWRGREMKLAAGGVFA